MAEGSQTPTDKCRPACACFTVPEEQWTRHYDATEPGSMVEPNPYCLVHFPQSDDETREAIGFLPYRMPRDARTWLTAILRDAAIQGWDVDECGKRATGLLADWRENDPESAAGVSSVSPEGETTPGEGEGRTEALWWDPTNRRVLWAAEENGWLSTELIARHFDETLSADAVKLGDVEMLRRQRGTAEAELNRRTAERDDAWNAADAAIAERDEARAELDQVRERVRLATPRGREWRYFTKFLDELRAIVEPSPSSRDREELAHLEIGGAGVPFEKPTGPKSDQCGETSPNGRKHCIRHRGHAGEHMASVIDTMWSSEVLGKAPLDASEDQP